MKKQTKKNEDKKITIEDLAVIVQQGFAEQDKKIKQGFAEQDKKTDKKIEDLAGMVRRGFDGVNEKFDGIDKRFDEVDKRFNLIETKFDRKFIAIENRLDGMDNRIASLEKGQEEIKMKLDNIVYRTEFLDIQKRIEILEKTIGVKN